MKTKTIVLIVLAALALPVLIIIVAIVVIAATSNQAQKRNNSINNFEQCVDAGYPVAESYPEVCRTQDGKSFVNPSQQLPQN